MDFQILVFDSMPVTLKKAWVFINSKIYNDDDRRKILVHYEETASLWRTKSFAKNEHNFVRNVCEWLPMDTITLTEV